MPESGSESQWEPEWESQRAIESQRETGRDPVRARESKKEASLTFLAYLNIVLSQNNWIRLIFVATRQNTVFFFEKLLEYWLWAKKNWLQVRWEPTHTLSHSGTTHKTNDLSKLFESLFAPQTLIQTNNKQTKKSFMMSYAYCPGMTRGLLGHFWRLSFSL